MNWRLILDLLTKLITSKEVALSLSIVALIVCLIVIYFLVILLLNSKIHHLRMEKSMQELEQFETVCRQRLESHYLTLAKEYLGEDYFNHIENYLYTYLIREPMREIKSNFRRRVRKNGFEHKTEKEWDNYTEECFEEDNSVFTGNLDRIYYRLAKIPRVLLYEHNKLIQIELKNKYYETMQSIYHIATDNKFKKFFKCELTFLL